MQPHLAARQERIERGGNLVDHNTGLESAFQGEVALATQHASITHQQANCTTRTAPEFPLGTRRRCLHIVVLRSSKCAPSCPVRRSARKRVTPQRN
jgi:hypothetical protein